MLKKVLIGCGSVIFVFVALFAAYAVWQVTSNNRAEAAGRAFCSAVKPGATVASVQAAAARHPAHPLFGEGSDFIVVSFQGGMFYGADCTMTVEDGKVATVKFEIFDD